ncbi:MAG: FHA domain-containing protein [Gammaproteobacteria bacterium]|nr:FHA domain-containing protein [Gammaproteobacteria bacterium]MDH4313697.1 FHA domain-containing protein [Gammaproteobacteria bacterium]MDH5215611.1 FHA domain-containing protein [Gammaproteobacteria bacterium]
MELAAAGLQEQPFRTHGKPLVYVDCAAQKNALRFLRETAAHAQGLGLFQGPRLSGKSTIIREFVEYLDDDTAVALVDGAGLNTTSFLNSVLSQFGYELQFNSANELINMLRVFALQQTATSRPPVLIVENTHAMNPSALRMLCELAQFRLKNRYALIMILVSDRSIEPIVNAPAMDGVGSRLTGSFFLEPLSEEDTRHYLGTKLRAGGCFDPGAIVPDDVCRRIHEYSGGWPGIIDRLVLLAIAKADQCPLNIGHLERPLLPALRTAPSPATGGDATAAAYAGPPRLILTRSGKTLKELSMERPRLLIGRSEHNDLCVNSKYVSRHHALLVRHGKATFLMDLNSTNGTYVNSRRVSNHVMQHDDVISLGQHAVKFVDPAAADSSAIDGDGFADTVIMKSLQDIRRLLARENTVSLPACEGDSAEADSASS